MFHPDPPKDEAISSTIAEPLKSHRFLDIPRELRDIIYGHLIPSGQVAILRVSQQSHDEVNDLLYKQGVYRLSLRAERFLSHPKVLNPVRTPPNNKVQKFNILITELQAGYFSPGFVRSVPGSGTCHITLVFKHPQSFCIPVAFSNFMEFLSTFKLVTLRYHILYNFHPTDRRNREVVEPLHTQVLQFVATSLRAALGYPEWKTYTCPNSRYQTSTYAKARPHVSPFPTAQYLEFHPREKRKIAKGC